LYNQLFMKLNTQLKSVETNYIFILVKEIGGVSLNPKTCFKRESQQNTQDLESGGSADRLGFER
jgi:hypothetical protein